MKCNELDRENLWSWCILVSSSASALKAERGRKLVFFLSFGGSLTKWKTEGILSREIRIVVEYLKSGVFDEIFLFTYDAEDVPLMKEMALAEPSLTGLHALPPPRPLNRAGKLGRVFYSLAGPLFHLSRIRRAGLLRTNQISGSWAALVAAVASRTPLVLRLGYILSRRHALNGNRMASFVSSIIERAAFSVAKAIIVTSELARDYVGKASGQPNKVYLVPTYVDPDVFRAKAEYDFTRPVLYVGRLTAQKNLPELIRACAQVRCALHIVGSGEQKAELEELARQVGCSLSMLGRRTNEELANLMHDYTIFVLPSLHEGLPKVLIEAMATGMICIGTNVPGTVDLIEDGVNGYLTDGVSADALETALRRAFSEERSALGQTARETVLQRFSIAVYAQSEAAILNRVMHESLTATSLA